MIHTEPEVIVLADSINEMGDRLTTFQLKYWRPIHSEVLRHRAFSHSVRSSRACPSSIYIDEVSKEPWGPAEWGSNQKGMVPGKEIENTEAVKNLWEQAAKGAALVASAFSALKVHKQITNRILEPYTYVYDVMTGTEWNNFYALRCAPDAQKEIQILANKMKKAQEESKPKYLKYGGLHLPYVPDTEDYWSKFTKEQLIKISAARCARVSYKLFDGSTSPEKDLELAERLIASNHWSPFEHQAYADSLGEDKEYWGNLVGWAQYRKIFEKAKKNQTE